MKKYICPFLFVLVQCSVIANPPDTIVVSELSDYEYSWTYSAYTALFDQQDRPFVYVASMELGIVSFDISDENNIVPVDTILPIDFGGLKATNIYESDGYLFVSLGGFQGFSQKSGMGIVDISDPANLSVVDVWDSTAFKQGCAIVVADGNYAYMGAMELGVFIMDVSDKSNIKFVSQLLPDPNWPKVPGLFSTPNARGMQVRNDTMYLAYDAGAFRMIDLRDKSNPVEFAKYINPLLDEIAQPAYNNVQLIGNLAFIPVDYCGLDVIDFSNPDSIYSKYWFNPWACDSVNWNGREGHTNQLSFVESDSLLFVSGGDSEALIYDVSNLDDIHRVGEYINLNDSVVSWGISANEDYLVLANVDNPLGVPYVSDHGGIRLLSWKAEPLGKADYQEIDYLKTYPVPSSRYITLDIPGLFKVDKLDLIDMAGKRVEDDQFEFTFYNGKLNLDLLLIPSGIYFVSVSDSYSIYSAKVLIKKK